MYCDTVDDVKKAAPYPGRYAVWARDKWDCPEFLDLLLVQDEQGTITREWFGVPLYPDYTCNMVLCDERLLGCEIEPDWRIG